MKETEIQKQVCEYLANKNHFFWRNNNTPIYDIRKKVFRAMPKYTMRGIADILVITDGGFVVFLEIKTTKGRLSADQRAFRSKCEEVGAEYYIINNKDQLKDLGL